MEGSGARRLRRRALGGAEIARLTELRAVARERLLAARLELGEPALLVPELEAMVAEEPLREERWRLLVLALYRAHRQADALAALRRARETRWPRSSASTPGPRCASWRPRCSRSRRRWCLPRQRAARHGAAVDSADPRAGPASSIGTASSPHLTRSARRRWPRGSPDCCSSRAQPGSARHGCWLRRVGSRATDRCGCCRAAAASWRVRSPSASCDSSSRR